MFRTSWLFLLCLNVYAAKRAPTLPVPWNVPIKSPDIQCQERGFVGACSVGPRSSTMCQALQCAQPYDASSWYDGPYKVVHSDPALEGTVCGISKVCKAFQCEIVPKESLPKYLEYSISKNCIAQ